MDPLSLNTILLALSYGFFGALGLALALVFVPLAVMVAAWAAVGVFWFVGFPVKLVYIGWKKLTRRDAKG